MARMVAGLHWCTHACPMPAVWHPACSSSAWPIPHAPTAPPTRRPQFVVDATGRLVVLGEGAQAVVYLGRLQGCDIAVKVRADRRLYRARVCRTDSLHGGRGVAAGALGHVGRAAMTASGHLAVWLQVYELPGVDASVVWNEAAMLRNAVGPRIIPLYGIAVQVSSAALAATAGVPALACTAGAALPCQAPSLPAAWQALPCLTALSIPALPPLQWQVTGTPGNAGHEAYGRRQPARRAAQARRRRRAGLAQLVSAGSAALECRTQNRQTGAADGAPFATGCCPCICLRNVSRCHLSGHRMDGPWRQRRNFHSAALLWCATGAARWRWTLQRALPSCTTK